MSRRVGEMFDKSDSGRDIFDDMKVIKLMSTTHTFYLRTTRQTYLDIVSHRWLDKHHIPNNSITYLRSLHYRHTGITLLLESMYTAAQLFGFYVV